ncbi:hypothetical protein ACFQGN_32005 [Streptomyces goshikiensis]|uniref:hypothetical protein n=1 Tax=Streptomyces goshikiensis TaxID=1942 RepID=UPI003377B9BD
MTSPGTPTDQTVTISRDILTVLAMVDITQTARRVLDFLLAIHDDETGVGHISQDEMRRALGSSKPSQVNPPPPLPSAQAWSRTARCTSWMRCCCAVVRPQGTVAPWPG